MNTVPNLANSIAHILSQTRENISFLQSVQQISSEDARVILEKLSSASRPASSHRSPDESAGLSMPVALAGNRWNNPSPPLKTPTATLSALSRPPPPIPTPSLFKARAVWGYNEDDKEADDLSFITDDIIEILDESNSDWWRGRINGRQGLFPSSYVEKLPDETSRARPNHSATPPISPNFPNGPQYSAQPSYPQQNSYYGPPQGSLQGGPYPPYQLPQNSPYPPYQVPQSNPYPQYQSSQNPPPPNPPTEVVNTEDGKKKKPGLFQGKLGNTLAQSAVGGVGFGAGSAVGGGIINAIF